MTPSARLAERVRTRAARVAAPPSGTARPLAVTGAIGAVGAMAVGLVIITPLVLAGWIAAPHAGLGLPGVMRTAVDIWLAAHHVGFSLRGAGRIGMLPLGLVLLPGALLWRAGKWVVRTGQVTRLRHVGYAALALAVPYALLCGALALASRSALVAPSLPEALVSGFLLAVAAGGLGGARALTRWGRLAGLLSPRPASVLVGTVGSLIVLVGCGAVLAGASLAAHLAEFRSLTTSLAPGPVGAALLLIAQLAYVPNAIGWAVSYTLGPGFAFGTGTVVAPTGSAIGLLPAFPMLAALPGGPHSAVPAWAAIPVLAVPYLAGASGGLLMARAAPATAFEVAPLWGFGCGVLTGVITGVLAAFAGGPLGSGRLAEVGPSGWQAGLVAALEVGVSAAVAAGAANWLRLRRDPDLLAGEAAAGGRDAGLAAARDGQGDGHRIYLDPWAGEDDDWPDESRPGPAALP